MTRVVDMYSGYKYRLCDQLHPLKPYEPLSRCLPSTSTLMLEICVLLLGGTLVETCISSE